MSSAVQQARIDAAVFAVVRPDVLALFAEAAQVLKPPPKMTVTEWAEANRYVSTETSASSGMYRAALAPYQRGMQDAVTIPGVEEVVLFTSSQIGKSTCLENIMAYFIAEDPCPIIHMWPTLEVAKDWSADTLTPLIRDNPCLDSKITSAGRKTGAGALFKAFPGGSLAIIGANSPVGLRRRRARVVIADEVDGYGRSAGAEGDPITLVAKRSETFWNAVRVLSSTCTIKGESRIEAAYLKSNRQKYQVPCIHCTEANNGELDGFQVLKFKRLDIDKVFPHEGTVYPCEHCGVALTEADKPWMLKHGKWVAERPEVVSVQGFWINSLYSPFVSWAKLAKKFLDAVNDRENPNVLKAFVQTDLAETWEEKEEKLDKDHLMERREDYTHLELPDGILVLTAGVDVQPDRLELVVKGWGKGQESWCVDWTRLEGDTSKKEVWARLDEYLLKTFYHSKGVRMEIASCFIDSGFRAGNIYDFTKTRVDRRIFATKGYSGFNKPLVGKWSKNNQQRVRLYPLGVDVLKELVYSRLKIGEYGAGYMHFSKEKNDLDYFTQLTCEHIERKYKNGFPMRYWKKPEGARNEALDCEVLALAAFLSLAPDINGLLDYLKRDLQKRAALVAEQKKKGDPNQLGLLESPASPPKHEEEPPKDSFGRSCKKCDNPLCDRWTSAGASFCCHGCNLAFAGKYEIHEDGPLGHSVECNTRHQERQSSPKIKSRWLSKY